MATKSPLQPSASISPAPILLPVEQAAAVLGLPVRTFKGMRDEPWAPKPVVLAPRIVRYVYAELIEAVPKMPRGAPSGLPPSLAKRAGRPAPFDGSVA